VKKNSNDIMKVKVISLEKCAATFRTIALVKEVARETGVVINLEHIIVKTPEDAVAQRHIGSPTVQINGLDAEPGAREIKQFGVT
jgi:3-keto-L-gulonate-6-phosphate decarboxylase